MPLASMREYAFGLVKASFQALIIFSLRYRKRYRFASREEQSLSRPLQAFVEGQNAEGRTSCLKFLAVLLVG